VSTLQEKFDSYTKNLTPTSLPEHCLAISDLHAAKGGVGDPLIASKLEGDIVEILKKFRSKGYTLLKGGDWWDTWRGFDLRNIFPAHVPLVEQVDHFRNDGKLYEILGNHERDLCSYPEAIIFEGFGKKIFYFHGYFGDWPNDDGWQVGREVVRMVNILGVDPTTVPPTSPHPSNIDRHLAVRKEVQSLADANPSWDFLWGHTHYFDNTGNNHNSGSSLIGAIQGYLIEEGNFIPL
jgi:hypothetical protein